MKSFTATALTALLTSGAYAAHAHGRRHAGRHNLEKRDVVWVTEYETQLVTVYETIMDGSTIVGSTAYGNNAAKAPATTSSSAPAAAATYTSSSPAAYYHTTMQTSTSPAAAAQTEAATSSSTTTSTTVAPSETEVATPTTTTTSTTTPPPPPPTTTTTTTPAYVAPTTTSAPPAATTAPASSGGSMQNGEVTFYTFDAGALGACGVGLDPNGATVAISPNLYGTSANPNDSPQCGRKVNIVGSDGSTFTATVQDRCEACDDTHLDLTYGLFGLVTSDNYNAGVVQVQWSWAS